MSKSAWVTDGAGSDIESRSAVGVRSGLCSPSDGVGVCAAADVTGGLADAVPGTTLSVATDRDTVTAAGCIVTVPRAPTGVGTEADAEVTGGRARRAPEIVCGLATEAAQVATLGVILMFVCGASATAAATASAVTVTFILLMTFGASDTCRSMIAAAFIGCGVTVCDPVGKLGVRTEPVILSAAGRTMTFALR